MFVSLQADKVQSFIHQPMSKACYRHIDNVHGLNTYDYGARQHDPILGRWDRIDPLCEKYYSTSPYVYCANNPVRFIDPDGKRKWPVNENDPLGVHVSSWYGPRNIAHGSKYHKGLDINMGSGNQDYGKTVMATHDGTVIDIHNSTKGSGGRYVIIGAPDGSFRTDYMHLSDISVEIGQTVKEGDAIGKIGGSGEGKENAYTAHLHYQIKKKDEDSNQWVPYNPTEGKGNNTKNIVDPQTWVSGPSTVDNVLPTIEVVGNKPKPQSVVPTVTPDPNVKI